MVQQYNAAVAKIGHEEWALPTFGRKGTLAVLTGNTKAIWLPFLRYVKQQHMERLNDESSRLEPLNMYVESCLQGSVSSCVPEIRSETRFSHSVGSEFVHMQLACEVSGLAKLEPSVMLNIHAKYGPWISLRGVTCFDLEIVDCDPLVAASDDLNGDQRRVYSGLKAHMEKICAPGYTAGWEDWLEARDIVGNFEPASSYRFDDDMIRYHYTHDRSALLSSIVAHGL
jgi:hypothetical protein